MQAKPRGTSASRRKPSSTWPTRSAAQSSTPAAEPATRPCSSPVEAIKVTGIDFLEEPIRRAKLKAAERGLNVTFLVKDAMTLKDWTERFDNVIDTGLFHVFSDEDRKRYVEGLATVLKPGGRLFLMCFSDEEPGTQGPRRVSKKELHAAFAQGWDIESIEPTRVEKLEEIQPACTVTKCIDPHSMIFHVNRAAKLA